MRLHRIPMKFIINECFPRDIEDMDIPIHTNNIINWGHLLIAHMSDHPHVIRELMIRIQNDDFTGFGKNPIEIIDNVVLNGHHRILAAWQLSKEYVMGVM